MNPAAEAAIQVARDMMSELDVEVVLSRALSSARDLTSARYAALGVLDETGDALSRFLTLGVDEEVERQIGSLPTGHGVLGELIRNPTPLRLSDVEAHPHSYGFPPSHPEMHSFLGIPIYVRGKAYGNLYLTEKSGDEDFTAADEEAAILLAEFAGLAIDHARRFTASESRRLTLERSVDALDATVTIAQTLAAQTDLETILDLVAKRGRALISSRALVIELEASSGELVVAAAAGDVPADLVGRELSLRNSLAGAAVAAQRTLRLDNDINRARFREHGLGAAGLEADVGLFVPLVLRGQTYGVLVALDQLEGGPGFSAHDEMLLEAFAASAATAVANATLVDSERRHERLASAETERARWARELHDETLQGFAALRLSLAAIGDEGSRGIIDLRIDRAIGEVDAAIEKLRSIITDLRPPGLDELDIRSSLDLLAERIRGRGIEVDIRSDAAAEEGWKAAQYDLDLKTGIYRITQEALNNAAIHAGATRITIAVLDDEPNARIQLTIRDDGNGFDMNAPTPGLGLRGMRERSELLDGTLTIESIEGKGTAVKAVLPTRPRHRRLPGEMMTRTG